MACNNVCKLCKKLTLSTAVNYDAGTNELIIGIPEGAYYNNEKYCIVVAQPIPTTTSISATVVVTIGTDPTRYPLVRRNCQQATACNISTRTKYSVCVATNTVSGVFKLLGDIGCCGADVIPSLPVTTTTTPAVANETPSVLRVADTTATTKKTKTTTIKEVEEDA
jgi:hypothetical protein